MNCFGSNLRYLRKKIGKNQSECGFDLNIPRATLSNYETGETEPPMDKIIEISDYFGISIQDLLLKDLGNLHLTENENKTKKSEKVHLNVHPSVHLNSDFLLKTSNKEANSDAISHLREINQLLHQNIASLNKIIEGKDEVIEGKNALIAQVSADNERLKLESAQLKKEFVELQTKLLGGKKLTAAKQLV
jgi:transcriptional regulator with XRE-family HTH domain